MGASEAGPGNMPRTTRSASGTARVSDGSDGEPEAGVAAMELEDTRPETAASRGGSASTWGNNPVGRFKDLCQRFEPEEHVWSEWVEDVFNESYFGAPRDGRAWLQETGLAGERRRVVRGGGYDDPPQRQRVSRRSARQAENFNRAVGFRCAADE